MEKQYINANRELDIQNVQYSEILRLSDTVPAGETKLAKLSISNLGHFYCEKITGTFTTLIEDSENPGQAVDDGVNHLQAKLVDGSSGSRNLFNDVLPMNLILSPGRVKSPLSNNVLTDTPSNSLFYPTELNYIFTVNGDILLEVYNDSDFDNSYEIAFHGKRLRKTS